MYDTIARQPFTLDWHAQCMLASVVQPRYTSEEPGQRRNLCDLGAPWAEPGMVPAIRDSTYDQSGDRGWRCSARGSSCG